MKAQAAVRSKGKPRHKVEKGPVKDIFGLAFKV